MTTSVRRVPRPGTGGGEDEENKDQATPYQPLQVLGGVREKGFSGDDGGRRVSLPQPTVRPFPVARHRSEGPHWAARREPETVPMPDGFEELGGEGLAALAKPLIRKKKPVVSLSRWKAERKSKEDDLDGNRERLDSSSFGEERSRVEEVKVGLEESRSESAPEAVSRPRVTFTLPIEKTADEVTEGRGKLVEYGELSRLRSDSGASSSGEVKVTGVETARTGSEEASIDEENRATIASMSAAEVAEAQAEIMSRLKPEVIEMLRMKRLKKGSSKERKEDVKRDDAEPAATSTAGAERDLLFPERKETAKSSHAPDMLENRDTPKDSLANEEKEKQSPAILQGVVPQTEQGWSKSWTERVEAVRLHRFDMQGHLVAIDEAPIPETSGAAPDLTQANAQNVAERDFLRSEGDPAAMGYTLKEAADLVRSTVAGHRTFALRLISSVLENAVVGLQAQKTTSFLDLSRRTKNNMDWQAVWAYALGPEPGLALTLRLALDDTHTTVVVSCAKALQALLSCSANNAIFDLHESCWPRMKLVFTGSVFRKHTKQDEGFLGGGRWKYNIKASELYPTNANSQEEDEGKDTVGDDATVASKDCAAGLIRMGLLPRIRYLLEVEKLKAAEDQLLDVIVALARHSPAASEAVMKCPRLVDAIIQRFILVKEDRDDGVRSAQSSRTKAIELLKVLSQASRLNCSKFFNSGAIQMAQFELYRQDHLSKAQSRLGDSICSTTVESLRLWQICLEYKMGMSSFMDIYPTLCFWLSPLTKEEISRNNNSDALSLAQESYRLLERLAQTLPRLHRSDEETLESFESDDENWAWSVAVPLVETALGWLSAERLSFIVEQVDKLRPRGVSSMLGNSTVKLIETLTSVLQFLATVSEKILGSSNDGENRGNAPFIPTFIPRLGLLLAGDNFVQNQNVSGTLFGSFCSIRHVKDEETTLAATSCLHAVVRLFNNVDEVIKTARAQSGSTPTSGESTQAHKILDAGLVLSSQRELQDLLSCAGDEVLANTSLLQSFEINGRGGPAPGLGLGWGALGGGSWSRQVLVAQATARLVLYLLDIIPACRCTPRVNSDGSANLEQSSTGEVSSVNSEILWRLSCGFGIAALASAEDGELVKQVCSKLLIHSNIMSLLTKAAENTLDKLGSVFEDLGLPMESLAKLFSNKSSDVLLENYAWTWTSEKTHKAAQNDLKGILKGSKSGKRLPTVHEDTGVHTQAGVRTRLAKEWARQRLPLPSHWILSPMATNITRLLFRSEGEEIGVSTVDVVEKSMMEETVKSGLFWVLGLEALFSGSLEIKSNPISFIPLVRKVHALSSIYVLGGDIFLQEETRAAIGVLQELYGHQLDIPTTQLESAQVTEDNDGSSMHVDPPLNFERRIDSNYPSFIESLGEQFGASSFGDRIFARQVAFHLQQGVPDPVRLALWRIVADAQALRLLPPLSQCCGHPSRYLYPFERNAEIVGVYVTAWTSGALETAAAQASVSFTLCLHHIAGYLFGSLDPHDGLAIKQVARTLVRSSMRKSQHQTALVKLLVHQPSSPHQGYKDLEARVAFLSEACEGDQTMLSQVERLRRLATPV